MLQKIIQVGNSYAVTIPKGFVEALKSSKKGFVDVYEDLKKKRIIVSFDEKELVEQVVNPEVYSVAKKLLRRYLPAFKELAKK